MVALPLVVCGGAGGVCGDVAAGVGCGNCAWTQTAVP